MRPRVLARACALALLFCAGALPAAPPEDVAGEAFAAGRRAFEAGDWQQALAAFEAARDAGVDDPALRYNIGVCQYRLGEYAGAERTFLDLAERYPAMAPLAWYNAGLAVYRQRGQRGQRGQREPERAAALFERARATDDPKIARMAAAMLERVAPAQARIAPAQARIAPAQGRIAPGAWTGFVDISLGADDNVALVDDASLPAGESTDSPFVAVFGQLGWAAPEGGFDGSASAYLVRYPDAGSFDQNIVQLAGTWNADWGDWRVDAGPHVSFSTLEGDSFERRLGASLTLDRTLGRTRFTVTALLEAVDELDPQFAFVDGSRGAVELQLERRAGPGRAAIEYALGIDDRAAPSVSPTRHRFAIGWKQAFDERWSMAASAAFRSSRYDDLATPRDEDRRELSLMLLRKLPQAWQLTLDYRYTSNGSNVDAFDYERNRFRIGVNRVFP